MGLKKIAIFYIVHIEKLSVPESGDLNSLGSQLVRYITIPGVPAI